MVPEHLILPDELEQLKPIVSAIFLTKNAYTVEPTGILLGGQPASGKTGLIRFIQQQNRDKAFVVINGDALRSYHPRSEAILSYYGLDAPKYTQPFSNALVEWLKAECIRLRYNFIIEGTMRTLAVIEQTAKSLKQADFSVEGHVLAVAREDSLLGVCQRFEDDLRQTGVGRMSPIATHDEAYERIPVNLTTAIRGQCFNRVVIYTRAGEGQVRLLYTIDTKLSGSLTDVVPLFASARQPMFDQTFYYQQWQAIAELARRRGETNADYLGQIDAFVRQFAP